MGRIILFIGFRWSFNLVSSHHGKIVSFVSVLTWLSFMFWLFNLLDIKFASSEKPNEAGF